MNSDSCPSQTIPSPTEGLAKIDSNSIFEESPSFKVKRLNLFTTIPTPPLVIFEKRISLLVENFVPLNSNVNSHSLSVVFFPCNSIPVPPFTSFIEIFVSS